MITSRSVDEYFRNQQAWSKELKKLREILLTTELVEVIKWGTPTYTINGKNVVGIGAFKSYCGLWFHQGSYLLDKQGLLINAQEGKTKGLRQMRFHSGDEINEVTVRTYVEEAIQNQKLGKQIKPDKKPLILPDELKEVLASNTTLSECFETLTLSCKREYAEYIEEAKKSETKQKRMVKIIPMIQACVGLNDRYK